MTIEMSSAYANVREAVLEPRAAVCAGVLDPIHVEKLVLFPCFRRCVDGSETDECSMSSVRMPDESGFVRPPVCASPKGFRHDAEHGAAVEFLSARLNGVDGE